jgi:hypothetical protein
MADAEPPSYAPTPEHEATCRRCGMSCHFAIEFRGERLIIPEIHCLYLGRDGAKRACTVYDRRFELAPWCQTGDAAAAAGFLAWDCPYTAGRDVPGGGKRWATDAQRHALLPHVRKALIDDGLERKYNPDAALAILTASGEDWTYRQEAGRYRFVRTDRPEGGDAKDLAPDR